MRLWRLLLTGSTAAALVASCGKSPASPSDPAPAISALDTAVAAAYQREFSLAVPRPAIFNDPSSAACSGGGYLATVAYVKSSPTAYTAYQMFMTRDGATLTPSSDGPTKRAGVASVLPAGQFRVLTAILTYPTTIPDTSIPMFLVSQAAINEQHAAFARSRGYAAPLVAFTFTNVAIRGDTVPGPRSRSSVISAVQQAGLNASDFDFLVVINVDPANSEGGFSTPGDAAPHFVYMGNYGAWKAPLVQGNIDNVANASYHHEIGHHWGWEHGWTPTCGAGAPPFAPFITSPMLFGWEDTDGDGVPEILDATPYGRT